MIIDSLWFGCSCGKGKFSCCNFLFFIFFSSIKLCLYMFFMIFDLFFLLLILHSLDDASDICIYIFFSFSLRSVNRELFFFLSPHVVSLSLEIWWTCDNIKIIIFFLFLILSLFGCCKWCKTQKNHSNCWPSGAENVLCPHNHFLFVEMLQFSFCDFVFAWVTHICLLLKFLFVGFALFVINSVHAGHSKILRNRFSKRQLRIDQCDRCGRKKDKLTTF